MSINDWLGQASILVRDLLIMVVVYVCTCESDHPKRNMMYWKIENICGFDYSSPLEKICSDYYEFKKKHYCIMRCALTIADNGYRWANKILQVSVDSKQFSDIIDQTEQRGNELRFYK